MKHTGIPRGLDENCHGTRPVKEQRTYETYQNCHRTGPLQEEQRTEPTGIINIVTGPDRYWSTVPTILIPTMCLKFRHRTV